MAQSNPQPGPCSSQSSPPARPESRYATARPRRPQVGFKGSWVKVVHFLGLCVKHIGLGGG